MRADFSWQQAISLAPLILANYAQNSNKRNQQNTRRDFINQANQIRGGYPWEEAEVETTCRGDNNGGRGSPKLTCQAYGKNGHVAVVCYHRFDKEYVP